MADDEELIDVLREVRDGQREVIALLSAQQALAREQIAKSTQALAESVSLQRLALRRQRTVTLVAVPGILACIAAILYLVMTYF